MDAGNHQTQAPTILNFPKALPEPDFKRLTGKVIMSHTRWNGWYTTLKEVFEE